MSDRPNSLFRQSTLDRMNSPEQLNEYIKVATPGVWMTLAAVILLLAGMLTWAVFGSIETRLEAAVQAENGSVTVYLPADGMDRIAPGQLIEAGGVTGQIHGSPLPAVMPGTGEACYAVAADLPGLADGVYEASLLVERIHPIRFILQ